MELREALGLADPAEAELTQRAEENVDLMHSLMAYHDQLVLAFGEQMAETLRRIMGLPYDTCAVCCRPFYFIAGGRCYPCTMQG